MTPNGCSLENIFSIFSMFTFPLAKFCVEQMVIAGKGISEIDETSSSKVTVTRFSVHLFQRPAISKVHVIIDIVTAIIHQALEKWKCFYQLNYFWQEYRVGALKSVIKFLKTVINLRRVSKRDLNVNIVLFCIKQTIPFNPVTFWLGKIMNPMNCWVFTEICDDFKCNLMREESGHFKSIRILQTVRKVWDIYMISSICIHIIL